MRKWAWLYVLVLFVVMAAPASARRVVNEGDKGFEVAAYIGEGLTTGGPNARTAVDGEGWVSASESQGGVSFNLSYSAYFGCEGHQGDGGYLESMSAEGYGWVDPETFVVAPRAGKEKFTEGFAEGYFEEGSLSYVWCDGTRVDTQPLATTPKTTITIDMTGDGYLYKTSDSGSFHIPGVQNDHFNWRGEYRDAYGRVDIGVTGCNEPCTFWSGGGIGKWSYSSHGNQK